jgi:3alpha(or 20beta)-hydroxysteroid dehydrogenase
MARLKGKTAIVTGAARGLGAAAARALCAEGASVTVADVLAERGEQTAAALRADGHAAQFLELDVRDPVTWARVVAQTVERFGRIDCLVNNAGITLSRTIEEATIEDFRGVFDINLIGTVLGMQAVIPVMRAQGGGSIVNISSVATRKVVAVTTVYGASKAAVAYVTKTAALHCAQSGYGIRVNSIHPGPHETDMLLGGAEHAADIPQVRQLIDTIPLRRMGKPEEIGPVVTFLASDDSAYVTAAELFVDGGVSAL